MKQLTIKTALVDTVLILITIFVASFLGNARPIRWILICCLLMAMLEIFITSYRAEDASKRNNDVGYYIVMFLALMLAICAVALWHLNWKQYVLCLGLVIASDAGGLFFGRVFGKTKPFFSAKLSPNKTWAGYLGEMITTWICGWMGLWILGLPITPQNVIYVMAGFIACSAGDLVGSGTKRELGIKHSSDLINDLPIFGKVEILMRSRHGYLDCMDSASFAIIFFALLQLLGRL